MSLNKLRRLLRICLPLTTSSQITFQKLLFFFLVQSFFFFLESILISLLIQIWFMHRLFGKLIIKKKHLYYFKIYIQSYINYITKIYVSTKIIGTFFFSEVK